MSFFGRSHEPQRALVVDLDDLTPAEVSRIVSQVIQTCAPSWITIDAVEGRPNGPAWARERLSARAPKGNDVGIVLERDDPDIAALVAFAPYTIDLEVGQRPGVLFLEQNDADQMALYPDAVDLRDLVGGLAEPPWRRVVWRGGGRFYEAPWPET